MDEKGEVIGVATFENTRGQNWNFAIAVEKVSAALLQPSNEEFSGPALPSVTPTIDAHAHFDIGMASLKRQEYDKAINDFSEAIRLDPNVAIIYFNRGNAYYDHGNLDKACSDYNEAIRLDPNFARAYVGRGDARKCNRASIANYIARWAGSLLTPFWDQAKQVVRPRDRWRG